MLEKPFIAIFHLARLFGLYPRYAMTIVLQPLQTLPNV